MLLEYALDPNLGGDDQNFKYIIEKFDIATPRRISEYPQDWKQLVYKAANGLMPKAQKRVEVSVMALESCQFVKRQSTYDEKQLWLENARKAEGTAPFHAILTKTTVGGAHPRIVTCDENFDATATLMIAPSSRPIKRSPAGYLTALSGFLKYSDEIIFVDPYFRPNRRDYQNIFIALMKVVQQRPNLPIVKVCLSDDFYTDRRVLDADLKSYICPPLMRRLKMSFAIMPLASMHNRYVITNLGTAHFGNSFHEDVTDDISTLLSKNIHQLELAKYSAVPNSTAVTGAL